ncbi:MAG: SPOR domain-containing protein [Bacteroidetes bacterium]|nr:SPOR domain-containing protein [Bacteroidota bacterium]
MPTKKIEPIKIEKPSAQVFEPIKIEKTTANAEAVKTPASPAKPVEPAKAAAPIAKAPEPAKPVVKAAEPNKIVVPTGRPGEPAKAAAPAAKPAEPNKIVVPTGRPEETAKVANTAPKAAEPAKAASSSNAGKTYKIQLGTFTSFNPSAFSGDKTLMAEKAEGNGANKLMIGNFTSEEEARKVAADFKKTRHYRRFHRQLFEWCSRKISESKHSLYIYFIPI